MNLRAVVLLWSMLTGTIAWTTCSVAETCTTQSKMKEGDRDGIAGAAREVAGATQANDAAALRAEMTPEFANNFEAVQTLVAATAPKLAGGAVVVDQIYLLDNSAAKALGDAQFFCSLNNSVNDVEFTISGLTAGVYGFATVQVRSSLTPWILAMLLRQQQGRWLLAGFYPHAAEAAGHDGLWYWREARRLGAEKQHWNAWLYYGQAEALLLPAPFLRSTHLDKLRDEQHAIAPAALSSGISTDVPFVVKGADAKEYVFTALTTDDTAAQDKVDLSAHLRVDQIGTPVEARKRNEDAMRALVAAFPELRTSFHGIWVVAEPAGGAGAASFATEEAMSSLH